MFVSVNVRVITDETGVNVEIPGLLTPNGILYPLVDYFLYRVHDRSIEWMTKVVRSVRMFLEYMQANPLECDTHILFKNFAQRLYTGTFDLKTGFDPSWLAWSARSASDARHIITDLTLFFRWLGDKRPSAAKINPIYTFSPFDRACDQLAYMYRRDASILGHTWGSTGSESTGGSKIRSKLVPHVVQGDPPAFPDSRFMDLIENGFRVGNRHDYRGILITLLCHGAGFRESEPFHLYVEDVAESPLNKKSALVRIHHPSQGAAPIGWKDVSGRKRKGNRATYLAERFGLLPRNDVLGSAHAGWKGGRHDGDYYKEAYWFQPEFGEIFLQVWYKYLHSVASHHRNHPYAFINLQRDPVGEMYTIAKFNQAHKRACQRIGLAVGKELGTTPHGHRHAYGRRLKSAGVDSLFIQKFMHHSSEESQLVYTSPSNKETQNALDLAAEKLRQHSPSNTPRIDIFLKAE
jgi:hypothetical protein